MGDVGKGRGEEGARDWSFWRGEGRGGVGAGDRPLLISPFPSFDDDFSPPHSPPYAWSEGMGWDGMASGREEAPRQGPRRRGALCPCRMYEHTAH